MTEEEAKKKQCPFQVIASCIFKTNESYNCIASDCMMWVWSHDKAVEKDLIAMGRELNGRCGFIS